MELKDQIIEEYLNTRCGYRKLQAKYGISRTTICKWAPYRTVRKPPKFLLAPPSNIILQLTREA